MNTTLVVRCQRGDLNAWQTLLQEAYPRAQRTARQMLRDKNMAQDAVQNAMVKLLRHLPELREPEKFKGWFRRIVVNEIFLTMRAAARERPGEIFAADSPLFAGDPLDVAETAAFRTEFLRSLRSLVPEYQDVIVLYDIQGYSVAETAAGLGIPEGTVKSRLHRGRELLRKSMENFALPRKERKPMHAQPQEEVIFDYLEGRLSPAEEAEFRKCLEEDPELQNRVEKQRSFLKVLHKMTGRISLRLEDIVAHMKTVENSLEDYRYTQYQTVYAETGDPPKHRADLFFKAPDMHRIELQHPLFGESVTVIKGSDMTSFSKKENKIQHTRLAEGKPHDLFPTFPAVIKTLTQNSTVELIDREMLDGRRCCHLTFTQDAPGLAGQEVVIHMWIEERTWFPLLEEYYDFQGKLVLRKEIQGLVLNGGLPDSLFEIEPGDAEITSSTIPGGEGLKTVTLDEAREKVSFNIHTLDSTPDRVLQQVQVFEALDFPVVLLSYHGPGQPVPHIVVTQGTGYHGNIPPGAPTEKVEVRGTEGTYVPINTPPVTGMVFLELDGLHIAVGGNGTKEEILSWAEELKPAPDHFRS